MFTVSTSFNITFVDQDRYFCTELTRPLALCGFSSNFHFRRWLPLSYQRQMVQQKCLYKALKLSLVRVNPLNRPAANSATCGEANWTSFCQQSDLLSVSEMFGGFHICVSVMVVVRWNRYYLVGVTPLLLFF